MKSNHLLNFVTNNRRFKPSDADYGKVYLVNIFLLALFLVCLVYLIFNLFVSENMKLAMLNVSGLVLATSGIIYFHKTDKVNIITGYSVLILFISIFGYLSVSDQSNHSLYWLVIIPPVIFFLLGHFKAKVVSFIYFGLLVLYIALNYTSWVDEGFGIQSFFNIIGPTIVLIFMINFYERSRSEISTELGLRNIELANTISELSDNQEKFEILLASTEEGIYGINLEGKCIFCNKSGLNFLGYNEESELLGLNMHNTIHKKYENGNLIDINDCKIFNVFKDGKGIRVSDEVFWKKDGTSFDVEYAAYPQYKAEKIIGVVISFRDITKEKAALERMKYLNCHDWLTGLYNRSCFESTLTEIDKPDNLPISIVFADINGLKLTNDIFGHTAGDKLLIRGAEVLKAHQRDQDLLARVGGDEFTLVLPRTNIETAMKIKEEIQKEFASCSVNAIPCSMAVGCATKADRNIPIAQIIGNAEGEMYKEKTISRQIIHEDMVYTLINILHTKSPRQKVHSENVMKYAEMLGNSLNLSKTEIVQLKKMAYFHDIGKIVLEDELLLDEVVFSKEQLLRMRQHPAIAYRILNLFDETLDIAPCIYAHHENWDGTGYPKGLKGEEIPYMARIISVAEVYDALTNKIDNKNYTKNKALDEIAALSGTKIDPDLARVFIGLMREKEFVKEGV